MLNILQLWWKTNSLEEDNHKTIYKKTYTAQKMKFSNKHFFIKCDLEILNGKLHFLCNVNFWISYIKSYKFYDNNLPVVLGSKQEGTWKGQPNEKNIKYICNSCRFCNALPVFKNRWRNMTVFTFHRFNVFTGFLYIFNIFLEIREVCLFRVLLKISWQQVPILFWHLIYFLNIELFS